MSESEGLFLSKTTLSVKLNLQECIRSVNER